MALRQSEIQSFEVVTDSTAVNQNGSCLTIPRGIGFLAFCAMVLGLMVVSFAINDLVKASQDELEVFKREIVSEEAKVPEKPKDQRTILEDEEKIKERLSAVWFGAAGAGLASGLIQLISSIWFMCTVAKDSEVQTGMRANLWIVCQIIVILMFLTIFGAISIAGYYPNNMILFFGIDFLCLNLFWLIGVTIVRREVGQLKDEPKQQQRQGISALSALLVL